MIIVEGVVSRIETGGLFSAAEIQTKLKCETFAKLNVLHLLYMKTIMRSTFEAYNFVKVFVEKSLLGLLQRLILPSLDVIILNTKQKKSGFLLAKDTMFQTALTIIFVDHLFQC